VDFKLSTTLAVQKAKGENVWYCLNSEFEWLNLNSSVFNLREMLISFEDLVGIVNEWEANQRQGEN